MIYTIDNTPVNSYFALAGLSSRYTITTGVKNPFFWQRMKPRVMLKSKDCNSIIITDFTELSEIALDTPNDSYTINYTIYKKCCDRWKEVVASTFLVKDSRVVIDTRSFGPGEYKVYFNMSVTFTGNSLEWTLTGDMTCYLELDCCPSLQSNVLSEAKDLLTDIGCVVIAWEEIGRDVRQKIDDMLMVDHYVYLLNNFSLSCSEVENVNCALNKIKSC
jgi:hypothetical protein